jgi:hypothetical protein
LNAWAVLDQDGLGERKDRANFAEAVVREENAFQLADQYPVGRIDELVARGELRQN